MTDIKDRYVVERWGGEGRTEVQASMNTNRDKYEVRVGGYDQSGGWLQYPPHVSADEETIEELIRGIREMAEVARRENLMREWDDLEDLIQQVSPDRARELLEEAAAN